MLVNIMWLMNKLVPTLAAIFHRNTRCCYFLLSSHCFTPDLLNWIQLFVAAVKTFLLSQSPAGTSHYNINSEQWRWEQNIKVPDTKGCSIHWYVKCWWKVMACASPLWQTMLVMVVLDKTVTHENNVIRPVWISINIYYAVVLLISLIMLGYLLSSV